MSDLELLGQVLNGVDGVMALGIAVWIITSGIKRFDTILQRHEEFTRMVLSQYEANNNELMTLVSQLCLQNTEMTAATFPKPQKAA